MPANPRQNGTVNKRQPTAMTAMKMTRAVGSVVASLMPTKAPMVTPAVTSNKYLFATPSPITWMSNINNIADAAPAVGEA